MSKASKAFHIGDIISITSGALVSPRGMSGVHDILAFMTGEELMTHQLPRASRECEDDLRAQFPDLAAIEFDLDTGPYSREEAESIVYDWLAGMVAKYGETREVVPLSLGDRTHIEPLTELLMLRTNAEVIPVVHGDE